MMGLQQHVRRAAIRRMAASDAVTDLVPSADIHGQTVPASPNKPFIKTGVPQVLPIRATCLQGANVNLPIDAFAGVRKEGGAVVETAEDHASAIGAAIEAAMQHQGETVTINGQSLRLTYRLTDIRLFPDGDEIDVFHWSGLLNCRAVAE